MKYKYIFLDLDDTIWDFEVNAKSSLEDLYKVKNLSRYFDDFEHFFDIYINNNALLWKQYGEKKITKDYLVLNRFSYPFTKVGAPQSDDFVLQMGCEYLDILSTKTVLVPYAQELLGYLSEKYPLTVVSNGFIEVQYKKMRSSDIEHYFSHIVFSEHVKAPKPDKRIFEHALSLNEAKAEQVVMIGDNFDADIRGAQNAGISTIYFNPKGKSIPEGQAPDSEVKSLSEVKNIL